ncbi:MAG: hypothetical protein ACE5JB_08490 [bacterium]
MAIELYNTDAFRLLQNMKIINSNYLIQQIIIWVAVILLLLKLELFSQTPVELQKKVDEIRKEIVEIRGLKFKRPVRVMNQSLEDFGKYLDAIIEKQMPEKRLKHYGKVVKMLGLYRGPELKDFKSMAKTIMQSQAAAYYDPASETFYVVMQKLPEYMLNSVYAHEIYHGLQDQYFDLDTYLLSQAQGKLNDDELLARQSVVEGEATYIMTLWTVKKLFGSIPEPSLLQMTINMQTQMDVSKILDMLKSGVVSQLQQGDLDTAIKAMEKIPRFLIETLVGAYLKGMGFIFEIQKQGWQKVQNLYTNPPNSTEQILHPEKWLAGEQPYMFEWPSFKNNALFADWVLLEENTIGEIQWRIIFAEYDFAQIGKAASAGWNGDLYAVFKNKNGKHLLLLLYTSWDSEEEAQEFNSAYQNLLRVKYPDGINNVKVKVIDKDVLIVEGGDEGSLDDLLNFMKKISPSIRD